MNGSTALALHRSSPPRVSLLRHSAWDTEFVLLALLHGVVLACWPSSWLIAIGLWWNSNTISHNFLHKPFFRSRRLNAVFSLYLSVLLGVPQTIWKARHLAHHAETRCRLRITPLMVAEVFLVLGLWALLLAVMPTFFLTAYLPGYAAGLMLCALHGYYEHEHGTTSHYGWWYNWLFFNDGFHVEHHMDPGRHWSRLRHVAAPDRLSSRWPAVLRWLDYFSLDGLERMVLKSGLLQRLVLRSHERAFRRLLPELADVRSVAIVGGGLFPRTAIILRRLLPMARLVVIDASAASLRAARQFLPRQVEVLHALYDPECHAAFDLVVVPLAFIGNRTSYYRSPAAPRMIIHDWLWRRRGASAVVSIFLLKRLNLISRASQDYSLVSRNSLNRKPQASAPTASAPSCSGQSPAPLRTASTGPRCPQAGPSSSQCFQVVGSQP